MAGKVTGLGVCGAGPSAGSRARLTSWRGIVYLEVVDRETGQNQRVAKVALSPDGMVTLGRAMVEIGQGAELGDIEQTGFSSISSVDV